jgi:hypothetical protein
MKILFCTLAAGVILTALTQPAQADGLVAATFEAGVSGWSATSFLADPNDDHPVFTDSLQTFAVTWSASGGNPGGTINEADQDSGWQYFTASSAFLGNESASLGGTLTFDLLRTDSNTAFPPQTAPPLAITDGATVLVFAPASLAFPSTANWTSYTLNLTTAAGGVFVTSETGPAATQAQLSSVLSNLTGLYILSDWYTGIGDSYNLDNVGLSSPSRTPEPASWVLMLAGVSALLFFRKRAPVISYWPRTRLPAESR